MPRDEMLGRMSSRELSTWMVLFQVHSEERDHQQHLAESGDGVVTVTGRDDSSQDDEEEDDAEAG